MPSRVEPIQEMCGAARCPDFWISSTVESVRSRVEPPAPYVTEKNLGPSCASCARVATSFSAPCDVAGGKNSKLKMRSAATVIRAFVPHSLLAVEKQCRQRPGNDAVQDCAADRGPETRDVKALHERADEPEQQSIDHENEQAERQHGGRQRKQHQQRPNESVDEAEHERGNQRSRERVDLNRRHQIG